MTAAVAAADAATKAAYKDAAIQISKGIALGAVPALGQAIDAYDTVESCITLYNADTPDAKEEAEFDLILALIGWIPGPGDGVKKSFRLVNRDPERFAPVLFDLLRFILSECGIKTSPEVLLAEVFNADKLQAEIDEVIKGVKGSSTYKALPNWSKTVITTVLASSRDEMPRLMGIVEKRLLKWKKVQRNSSAASSGSEKPAAHPKPAAKDAVVASEGRDGGSTTHTNHSDKSTLGQRILSELSNEVLGVIGEHIADYICAEQFGWGKDWEAHDKGADGRWTEGTPSLSKMGKLSKGGDPKAQHILYKLTDPANGTGIDSVWRASPANNNGKKFAIIEAKASRKEDSPKFLKKTNNTRKPSVRSTIGVSGIADISELLEPTDTDSGQASSNSIPAGSGKRRLSQPAPDTRSSTSEARQIVVQMSKQWIEKNLSKAVGAFNKEAVQASYSRHLFYAPIYHPSGSPKDHALAARTGNDVNHENHDAFHYDEVEVKKAVNKKKKALAVKHGNQSSLAVEQ